MAAGRGEEQAGLVVVVPWLDDVRIMTGSDWIKEGLMHSYRQIDVPVIRDSSDVSVTGSLSLSVLS